MTYYEVTEDAAQDILQYTPEKIHKIHMLIITITPKCLTE